MKWAMIGACIAAVAVAGCTTVKEYAATGGSRADGTVRLSYEVGMFEQAVVDEEQGLRVARQRCATWGYSGAEAFGGVTRQCTSPSSSGCNVTLVTKEYQCTGTGGRGGMAEIRLSPVIVRAE